VGDSRLSVGNSGWSYPDWVGPFYPTGTLPRDFLTVYAREFGAVEIDTFLTAVGRLGPKLGLLVLQLDAGFRVDRLPVFAFANNRFQGHGSATARMLLTRVAGTAPQP
jgi:hypothetical protein